MVAAHIMDERTSVALKFRGEKLFGPGPADDQDKVKAWLKDETKRRREVSKELVKIGQGRPMLEPNYSDVPLDIMGPYAKGDVELTRRIGDVYDKALADDPQLQALYDMEMDVMRSLFWMEDRGIPMDRRRWSPWRPSWSARSSAWRTSAYSSRTSTTSTRARRSRSPRRWTGSRPTPRT
jgi:DNA polymerase I-like protein with 3'-5' exonuclease and polymerase domains